MSQPFLLTLKFKKWVGVDVMAVKILLIDIGDSSQGFSAAENTFSTSVKIINNIEKQ